MIPQYHTSCIMYDTYIPHYDTTTTPFYIIILHA